MSVTTVTVSKDLVISKTSVAPVAPSKLQNAIASVKATAFTASSRVATFLDPVNPFTFANVEVLAKADIEKATFVKPKNDNLTKAEQEVKKAASDAKQAKFEAVAKAGKVDVNDLSIRKILFKERVLKIVAYTLTAILTLGIAFASNVFRTKFASTLKSRSIEVQTVNELKASKNCADVKAFTLKALNAKTHSNAFACLKDSGLKAKTMFYFESGNKCPDHSVVAKENKEGLVNKTAIVKPDPELVLTVATNRLNNLKKIITEAKAKSGNPEEVDADFAKALNKATLDLYKAKANLNTETTPDEDISIANDMFESEIEEDLSTAIVPYVASVDETVKPVAPKATNNYAFAAKVTAAVACVAFIALALYNLQPVSFSGFGLNNTSTSAFAGTSPFNFLNNTKFLA